MVDPDPCEVINVSGLGQTHHRVDQNIRLPRSSSSDRQFSMSSVHGISCLEGDNSRPPHLVEMSAKLGRGKAESDIIIVIQPIDGLELASDVVLLGLGEQVLNRRVFLVPTKDFLCFFLSGSVFSLVPWSKTQGASLVRRVHIVHGQNGKITIISRVA